MNFPSTESQRAGRLWRAVVAALAVAALLLFTAVLPAEYGFDPTGVGRLLGLQQVNGSEEQARQPDPLAEIMAGNTVAAEAGAHSTYEVRWSSEEAVIELAPLEEVEVKATLAKGATLLYAWEAERAVYADTHGEPPDYPESPAVRYDERDGIQSAYGQITAPFAGLHGWYWLNTSEEPISIRLQVVGFYESLEEVYRSSQ
jgi:hypothetical protein